MCVCCVCVYVYVNHVMFLFLSCGCVLYGCVYQGNDDGSTYIPSKNPERQREDLLMVTGCAYVCVCVCVGRGMDEDEITLVVVVALNVCGRGWKTQE